jgi:hypothetical protein
MRRDWMVTALCLVVLGLSYPARAEIRVFTDRHGNYLTTRVLQGGRRANVWGSLRRSNMVRSVRSLNVYGDNNGDLFPTIRENELAPHHPWVVWSRYNQAQYDLAWSRWTQSGWDPIRWLDPSNEIPGDNLDADLDFDDDGRPYVAWWRNERGVGRVYVSVFLATSWMQPFAVSETGADGRYPTIVAVTDDELVVHYTTPDGLVEQSVLFGLPITITDDINPLDFVQTGAVSLVSEGD